VTNGERARRMLRAAEELLAEARQAAGRQSWNLAVRRSQEVVELTLKGVLSLLGADYPKTHDVGEVFASCVRERLPDVDERALEDVVRVSADLARKRAPAFYFEEESDQPAAEASIAQAERVFCLGHEIERRSLPPAS
jgi:HEPN domain-containing protein